MYKRQGKGVHIVTVNDYLAKRDSEWMGKVYRYLGLSVGLIIHDMDNDARRAAYACDITYGTNNEIGFDYLRDNMVTYKEQRVQRPFSYAIVDEVDSILIDEARTPLIISGQGDKSTDLYKIVDRLSLIHISLEPVYYIRRWFASPPRLFQALNLRHLRSFFRFCREDDEKPGRLLIAGHPDLPAVEFDDFLGDGKAQAGAAGPAGTGAVQTVKLLKDGMAVSYTHLDVYKRQVMTL